MPPTVRRKAPALITETAQRWKSWEVRHGLWDFLSFAIMAGTSAHLWTTQFPFPTGLDGAQWLAYGRGIAGSGRSSESTYAPLLPALAALLHPALGSISTVRALAALAALAMFIAIWLVARSSLRPQWGFVVVALAVPASALAEPLLFGGYPQQFAFGLGLVALWSLAALVTMTPNQPGVLRYSIILGLSATLTAASHLIYFPLVLACGATTILLSAARNPAVRRSTIAMILVVTAPAIAVFAAVAFSYWRLGYHAPTEPTAQPAISAWLYGTREAPFLWAALAALAFAAMLVQSRRPVSIAWLLGASMLLTVGSAFLAFGQARLIPPLLVGIALLLAIAGQAISARFPGAATTLFTLFLLASLFLAWHAIPAVTGFAAFYRVLDQSTLNAAHAIATSKESGGIAVRRDQRGWPIGWWIEALQDRPVLTDSDAAWLAFPDERERAARAAALFDGSLTTATVRQHMAADDVRFLVVRKWEWIGWDRWLHDPDQPLSTIYDDDVTLVLQLMQ